MPPHRNISFATRLTAYFGGLFFAAQAVLFFLWYFGLPSFGVIGASEQRLAQATQNLELAADYQHTMIADNLLESRGDILIAAENKSIATFLEQGSAQLQADFERIFNRLQRAYPDRYQRLMIVNPTDNRIRASSEPGDLGYAFQDPALIKRAAAPGITELVEQVMGKDSAPVLAVVRQIHAPDAVGYPSAKLVGILIAFLEPHYLISVGPQNDMSLSRPGGTTLLFDTAGQFLASSAPAASDPGPFKLNRQLAYGFDGTVRDTDADGNELLVVYRYLRLSGAQGWTLVHYMSVNKALEALRGHGNALAMFAMVLILAALALISAAARRLARPLHSLAAAAGQLGAGDLSVRVPSAPGESREIVTLADAFNRMAESVENSHLTLETRVGERTAELQQSATLLRETIQRLKLATDTANIGIWSWNFSDDRLEWDERLCAWYDVPEEVRNTGLYYDFWRSRVHPDDVAQAEALLNEAGRSNIPYNHQFRIVLPDGSIRHLHSAAVFEHDASGAPRRIIGINLDITGRKQYERELQQTRDAAEAASRAKSKFLANMSHELRTPMNAILGLAQLLEREPLSPDQRDMVQRIRAAGRSLLSIINDILDFSRIESGRLRIEVQPFALAPLLAHLESLQGSLARANGLAFRIEAPVGLTGGLLGDALRLEQILLNLIGNAIKFTPQGEIQVRVQPAELTETTVRLRFEVHDTGFGIAPEVLATLFQPFTQADGSITRRFGGAGLGLSICQRLVDLMGGTIGADSAVGVGSVFWFELPFERTTAIAPTPEPGAPAVTPAEPRLAGRRVLVVDDSDINRDLVARALAREGVETTLTSDGQQALTALRATPQGFDAVLMDVQMPVLDGLSATRAIRSELGLTELPVIAFTAGVLDEDRQQALAAGVNDFLAKPVDLEEMVAVLLRWICPPALAAAVLPPTPETPPPGAADQQPSAGLPAIAGFDAQQVALTFGDDREFFLELLGMFCASFRNTAQEVQTDLATGAREAAARRLHTLKGTAGNLGALALMRSAQALERAIIDGQPEAEPLLEQLTTQLTDLLQAAAPWLPG